MEGCLGPLGWILTLSPLIKALAFGPTLNWILLTIDESWEDGLCLWVAARLAHLPVLLHSASERQQRSRLDCSSPASAASGSQRAEVVSAASSSSSSAGLGGGMLRLKI